MNNTQYNFEEMIGYEKIYNYSHLYNYTCVNRDTLYTVII